MEWDVERGGSKLEKFIHFLRAGRLMDEKRLGRSIRQYSAFDRRFGQLCAFLGYIRPEKINDILLETSRRGGKFGDCAVRLKLLTPDQAGRLAGLQTDDLSIFAQAVGIQNAATSVEYTSFLTDFIKSNPGVMEEPAPAEDESVRQLGDKLRAVLGRVDHISPMPGTVEKAVAMLDDPEVDLDKVALVLKLDPGLTATLLRVANSAFYGLRSKIGSSRKALHVLGTAKLRQLIVTSGIMQMFQSVPHDFLMKFWPQALRTAECSKSIGKFCRIQELDELFVCGLLHNVGELVIRQFLPADWAAIEALCGDHKPAASAEKEVLGAGHADIGGFLFHLWKLPPATTQCAMYHHMDVGQLSHMPNLSEEVFIVHMAATLSGIDPNLPAYEYTKSLDIVGEFYGKHLKLPKSLDMTALMQRVDSSVEQMTQNSKFF